MSDEELHQDFIVFLAVEDDRPRQTATLRERDTAIRTPAPDVPREALSVVWHGLA